MRTLLCLATLLVLAACSASQSADPAPGAEPAASANSPVIATIDGDEVTLAELDEWIKDELLREQVEGKSPSAVHQFREEHLNEMIEEQLIETAAAAQGVSAEQLLAKQAEQVSVTDEEIEAFYTTNQARLGGASLDELKPRIRRHLESSAARDAQRKFLADLRQSASVVVLIEAPRVQVAAEGPSMGPDSAPITIVEFSDFQCPFCARAGPIVKEVLKRYPEQVRVVYRHFPLESIHPEARGAAEASLCAEEQDAFWPYHDLLFANTRALSTEDLTRYAGEVGMDVAAFEACMADGRHKTTVNQDIAAARQAGVSGTPAFFVNGLMLSGAQPVEEFVRIIDAELARQPSS